MDKCLDVYGDDYEPFTGPFLEFIIGIPIFIILQLSLLFHSIYHELSYRDNEVYQQVSRQSRILYISLQLIGLYWTIIDLFRLIIDPHTHISRGNTSCDILGYSPLIVPAPYYLVYLYQILLRLDLSFKGSYLELSKRNLYTLGALTLIPVICGTIFFFIINLSEKACIASWIPDDFKYDDFTYCDVPFNPDALPFYMFVLIWIPIINIIIGIIFGIKLSKLLSNNKDNDHIKFQFKSLIVKICILTLTGSISTFMNYGLWSLTERASFLYLDLFFKLFGDWIDV